MPLGDAGKYLGYWWRGDLTASRSTEENILPGISRETLTPSPPDLC